MLLCNCDMFQLLSSDLTNACTFNFGQPFTQDFGKIDCIKL